MRKKKIEYKKCRLTEIKRAAQARDLAQMAAGDRAQRDMFLITSDQLQGAAVRPRTSKY